MTSPQDQIRVRVKETYPNQFWNSASGLTLRKGDLEGQLWRDNDPVVNSAIRQGLVEVVPNTDDDVILITDKPSREGVLKEVVTPSNVTEMKETVQKLKKGKKKTEVS